MGTDPLMKQLVPHPSHLHSFQENLDMACRQRRKVGISVKRIREIDLIDYEMKGITFNGNWKEIGSTSSVGFAPNGEKFVRYTSYGPLRPRKTLGVA